jgi:hypothetical protein
MISIFIVIASITYVIALLWSVDRHYKLWKFDQSVPDTGSSIKHKKESAIRVAKFIPSIVLFSYPFGFWDIATTLMMIACVTWFLFDGLFNTKRGKDWWFIGTIDKDESFFDNFKRWIGLKASRVIQIVLAIGSMVLRMLV